MYQKLVRWLRILGYDTTFDTKYDDIDIIQIAKKENRIIVTRDEDLVHRGTKLGLQATKADGKSIEERLLKLQKVTGIDLELLDTTPSRCTVCNGSLKSIPKDEIIDKLQEGTKKQHQEFWICTNEPCQQVFWKGPHWDKIKRTLDSCKDLSKTKAK